MEWRKSRREFLSGMGAVAAAASFPEGSLLAGERLYPPADLRHFDTPIPGAPFELHIGYAAMAWSGNDRQAIEDSGRAEPQDHARVERGPGSGGDRDRIRHPRSVDA